MSSKLGAGPSFKTRIFAQSSEGSGRCVSFPPLRSPQTPHRSRYLPAYQKPGSLFMTLMTIRYGGNKLVCRRIKCLFGMETSHTHGS